jgi:hypothetical protein
MTSPKNPFKRGTRFFPLSVAVKDSFSSTEFQMRQEHTLEEPSDNLRIFYQVRGRNTLVFLTLEQIALCNPCLNHSCVVLVFCSLVMCLTGGGWYERPGPL